MFRTAGNELRNENEALASYVDMASDQMRRFADQIRQKGVADMLDDVHNSRAGVRRCSSAARSWSASASRASSRARRSAGDDARLQRRLQQRRPDDRGVGRRRTAGDFGEAGY